MKEELKKIGLTAGEAGVYLALLKHGSSTVGPVVKESKVAYSKVYEILGRLTDKGLVSFVIRNKTKYFQAVEPNRLKDFLTHKSEEIFKNQNLLSKILPSLENLSKNKNIQSAEIFTGINGLKTAYEILLKNFDQKTPLCFFYVHDEDYALKSDEFYEKEFLYFKKLNLKLKGITTRDYKKSEMFRKNPKFIELRFVNFPLPSTIDIYGDKALFTTWKENPFAFLITSREISENLMRYFQKVWKISMK